MTQVQSLMFSLKCETDPTQKMSPKAIYRQVCLVPVLHCISFNSLETVSVFLLRLRICTYFQVLSVINNMTMSQNAPKAIFIMGYLAPVLRCISFRSFLLQFDISRYFESLIMESSITISKQCHKSYFRGSAGITYVQFCVHDLQLMLLRTLKC